MTLEAYTVCVTPLRQNCAILCQDDGRAVVVDPGGDCSLIMERLKGLTVEAVLLTHGHLDHAGGAAELKERLEARQGHEVPIFGPGREDAFLLHTIEAQAAAFGIAGMRSVTPDRYLEDGERLSLLGHVLEVAHVPGHTPGHVVFIDHASHCAIVGDTLFRGTVGRTDFVYGNGPLLIRKIREKLFTLPDETVVVCGHGLPTTIGEERKHNPYFQSDTV